MTSSVEKICDAIGRKNLIAKLGISKAAIANAVSAGHFPTRWYQVVKQECEGLGIACPDELFNFIGTLKNSQDVDTRAEGERL